MVEKIDLLNFFGHRFNVDDFEVILRSLISNFACKGVDDLMKIFILDTETKSESDILTFISTKTGVNSRGFKVVKVPEIPRDKSGKIIYTKLN